MTDLDWCFENPAAAAAEIDRLEAQIREDIAPCVFHDNAHADCVQHSGQAPCMTQTESDWLREMQKERDALAAHVERLTGTIEFLLDTGEWSSHATVSQIAKDDISLAPATSFARLRAEWQAEALQRAADELCDNIGGDIGYGDLMDYAENLRCQSGGSDP